MPAYVYVPRDPLATERYYVLLANQSVPEAPVYFGQGEDISSAVLAAERTKYDSMDFWPLPPSGRKVTEYLRLEEEVVLLEEEPTKLPEDAF